VKLPTAEPVAFLGTILTPVAEEEPTAEPVPLFAFLARLVTLDEPVPELEAVNCHIGAPM
tara:strand:+ start:1779 stop:1958 length:180 start_codon:yes stop_codon:yes gene_type:complete